MTLRDEILARADCSAMVASKDCNGIAVLISIGRTQPNALEIGNGTILSTLGLTVGNNLLDVINSNPSFKYVKPLTEQGRLQIGTPLVAATVQSLVPSVLTQAQADALIALGRSPATISPREVAIALFNDDGTTK